MLHALYGRSRQHRTDEVQLAGARLSVFLGDGPDCAVVLDDAPDTGAHVLAGGQIAVFVENLRKLRDLGSECVLAGEAGGRVGDALLAACLLYTSPSPRD